MKHRRIISFALVLAVISGISVFAPAAFTADGATETDVVHNIIYNASEDIIISTNNGVGGYSINLTAERIMPASPAPENEAAYISFNGGLRWSKVSIPSNGLVITKQLRRGANVRLATDIDKRTVPEGETQWIFPAIEERPKLGRLVLDYSTYVGQNRWTIEGDDTSGLNIAVVGTNRNAPPNWGAFNQEKGMEGVNILPFINRAVRTPYLIRIAPSGASGSSGTFAPASLPRRLNVSSETRPTAFRIDYARESIRAKVGVEYRISADKATVLSEAGHINPATGMINPKSIEEIEKDMGWVNFGTKTDEKFTNVMTDRDLRLIMDNPPDSYNYYGHVFMFRTIPADGRSARRPPSAWQTVTIAEIADFTAADALNNVSVSNNGRVTVNSRNVEVWDEARDRWGSGVPADSDRIRVRFRSTARHNARTNVTTGRPASDEIELTLVFDEGRVTDVRFGEGNLNSSILFHRRTDFDVSKRIFDKDLRLECDDYDGTVLAVFDVASAFDLDLDNPDDDDLTDNFTVTLGGTQSVRNMFRPKNFKLDFSEGTPATTTTADGVTVYNYTATVSLVPLSDTQGLFVNAFTAGNLTVRIDFVRGSKLSQPVAAVGNDPGRPAYTLFSDVVRRDFATSAALRPVSVYPKDETSEIWVTASPNSPTKFSTNFEIKVADSDPVWALTEIEFAVTNNGNPPNAAANSTNIVENKVIKPTTDTIIDSTFRFTSASGHNYAVFARGINGDITSLTFPARTWVRIYTVTAENYETANATVSSAAINGTVGSAINTTPPQTVTITLDGNSFTGISARASDVTPLPPLGADISSWFPNRPAGLTARVHAFDPADSKSNEITVAFSGTPRAVSTADMVITIPANRLTHGNAPITVDANPGAKYNIDTAVATITTNITLNGKVGTVIPDTPTNTTRSITITVDKGVMFTSGIIAPNGTVLGTDVSSWFTNRPAGVIARVVNGGSGSSTITIEFSGTPTATSSANMTVTIPATALSSNSVITATPGSNVTAAYNIIGVEAIVENITVSGIIDEERLPALVGSQLVVISLTAEQKFVDSLDSTTAFDHTTNISSWFTNLPNNLRANAIAFNDDRSSVTIQLTGIPMVRMDFVPMNITIPHAFLQDRSVNLTVTPNPNANFRIELPIPPTTANNNSSSGGGT
jgi:hypothetical protein